MTTELTTALIFLAAVLVGGWYVKDIINNREETKRIEAEAKKEIALAETEARLKTALSEEETKHTRIIAGLADREPTKEKALEGFPAPPPQSPPADRRPRGSEGILQRPCRAYTRSPSGQN